MTLKSFRFWVYWHGSPVKLTLTAANTKSNPVGYRHAERTNEGWNSEAEVFWLESAVDPRRGLSSYIHGVRYTDGRDCDGRLSTETHFTCPTHRLHVKEQDFLTWPDWKAGEYGQRDYSAEAANY